MTLAAPFLRRAATGLAAAAILLAAAPVLAAVPSPATSTIPACVKASPDASLVTIVTVRDLASNPVPNSLVQLIYADCDDFKPCPQTGTPPDNYTVNLGTETISAFTDAAGKATFNLRAGGGCHVYPIRIYADGVFFGARPAASTDQNGDYVVDAVDVAILQSKVGGSDLTGDLDCDGVINSYDVSIQDAALGSTCLDPTPSKAPTWGRVKLLYR